MAMSGSNRDESDNKTYEQLQHPPINQPSTGTSSSSSPSPSQLKEDERIHKEMKKNNDNNNKWGTQVMGSPSNPTAHPDNQKAATWKADEHQQIFYSQQLQQQQSYVLFSPFDHKPHSNNPFETVANMFNSWSRRAETIGRNIWHNLRMGPSVSETVCGKIGLTAKAISEGGFESLFKQFFEDVVEPNESLKKTFACYLSTTTGPVAGTLYLSTHRVAFCGDRPLSFLAPSGQEAWAYYKVMIPLGRVSTVNPVTMGTTNNQAAAAEDRVRERYIQLITIDDHHFWFMGFVNFDKASHHLSNSVSQFRSAHSA